MNGGEHCQETNIYPSSRALFSKKLLNKKILNYYVCCAFEVFCGAVEFRHVCPFIREWSVFYSTKHVSIRRRAIAM